MSFRCISNKSSIFINVPRSVLHTEVFRCKTDPQTTNTRNYQQRIFVPIGLDP